MEQPREPRFYPNNQESNGIMYEDIQIMELKRRVAELEAKLSRIQNKEKKLEDVCLFHWLRCLYKDYLDKKTAGEKIPCETCPLVMECNSNPISNFNLVGERVGIKLNCVIQAIGEEKLI